MRDSLDADSGLLKQVYLECLKLESYGAALIREIYVNRNKEKQNDYINHSDNRLNSNNNNNNKNRISSTILSNNDYYHNRTLEEMRHHLSIVAELSKDIINRLWGNIERIWDIAAERPTDLVLTFEVIEMHYRLQERRNEARKKRALMEGYNPELDMMLSGVGPLHADDNIREQALERISRNINEKIEGSFLHQMDIPLSSGAQGETAISTRVTATVEAANVVIASMINFKNSILPCIPRKYVSFFAFFPTFNAILIYISHYKDLFLNSNLFVINIMYKFISFNYIYV